MRRIVKGVVGIALVALSLTGCGTFKSDFNYAGDATETVTLIVPEPLRVRSLDGQSARLPLMLKYPYTVILSAGPHTISFQYGESWGEGRSSERVRSPIMELNFDARSGEHYQLDYLRPESVRNYDLAEEYVAGFSAWLLDARGQQIAARSTGRAGGLGEKLVSISNAGAAVSNKAVPAQVETPAETAVPSTRLQSMQQLWGSASDDEKKAFMQWVVAPGS